MTQKKNLAVVIEKQLQDNELKSTHLNVCRWNEKEIADAAYYFEKMGYKVKRSTIPNELEVAEK